jgi:hypothetical protein
LETLLSLYLVGFGLFLLYRARHTPKIWSSLWPYYRFSASSVPIKVEAVSLAPDELPKEFASTEAEMDRLGYRFLRVHDNRLPHVPEPIRTFNFTADGIITAAAVFNPDGTRRGVTLSTTFDGDSVILTSTPTGDTVETPTHLVRFRRTLDAADEHHRMLVTQWQSLGRVPKSILSLEDFRQEADDSARVHRRIQMSNTRVTYRRLLIHTALFLILPPLVTISAALKLWIPLGVTIMLVFINGILYGYFSRDLNYRLANPPDSVEKN